MNEKLLSYYEDLFNIERERVQELVDELAKDIIKRILREEINNEYIIETIYQIGKTEDERLFLAYFIGGIKQTMTAVNLMKMLEEALMKKTIVNFVENYSLFTKLTSSFWDEMVDNLGLPDYDKIVEDDENIVNEALLANKKIDEIIEKMRRDIGRDENDE